MILKIFWAVFILNSLLSTTFILGFSAMDAFKNEQIVPDVIPVAPSEVLEVIYSGGVKVDLGKELTPTQVKDQPSVKWNADPNSLYTLCMTDPDAPSRQDPKIAQVKHWLVGNVPGTEIEKGETLTQYAGSGPPRDTGLHRYVFLVYKQPGTLTFDEPRATNRSREGRLGFNVNKFAEKYNLGNPVAGNFYQAKYDDYVPTLHKQLSGQ